MLSAVTQAENVNPWWVGLGVGIGEVEVVGHDRRELVSGLLADAGYSVGEVVAGEDDGTDTLSLSGGYHLSRYVGVVLSYQDAGTTNGNFVASLAGEASPGAQLQGSIQSDYRTFSAAARGFWPLLKWLVLQGELGVHRWQHDFELQGANTLTGAPVEKKERDAGYGALYGFGVGFIVQPWLGIDLYWQRFDGVEGEPGIDVKSIEAQVRF
jgi:hypothetical protein